MCNEKNDKNVNIDFFKEGKELEKASLDCAISKVPFLQKFQLIDNNQQERPDFLMIKGNEILGIEHFFIDLLYVDKKKHAALSRMTYKQLRDLYETYHGKVINDSFDSKDADESAKVFEKILNEIIEVQNSFNYNYFIKEWKRVFEKHYGKRKEYRQSNNLDSLGFLIEIRSYLKNDYQCLINGKYTYRKTKHIPFTEEIVNFLNRFDDGVDFYIVVVKGILDDSTSVEIYDKNHLPKIDCKRFVLKKIFKRLSLNVQHTSK